MEEFKQIQQNLLDMLEDIDEKLGKVTDIEALTEKNGAKKIEATLVFKDNNQTTVSVEHSMRNDIKNIKQAISQIDNGTYGICLRCGQPIKKEGLNKAQLFGHCSYCAKDKKDK